MRNYAHNDSGNILNRQKWLLFKPAPTVPQPKASVAHIRTGLAGVIDSLQAAQHALEMFRRELPIGAARRCLDRLSNRLTKIIIEGKELRTP